MKVEQLVNMPAMQFEQLLTTWKRGVELIWKDENPQAVMNAVHSKLVSENKGTMAELFQASSVTAAFLEGFKNGCTTETMALIKPFTVNQDGTIAVNAEE
jgi:hypothetical protein